MQSHLTYHSACMPPAADVAAVVAEAIAEVVDMPFGKRPFHIHINPAQDGCEVVVNAVADRIRAEFLCRIGLSILLSPGVDY